MGKIIFFIALGIVAITMIIGVIRFCVYEIKLKILKKKHSNFYSKAEFIKDEGKAMQELEKKGDKKEIDSRLDIYKSGCHTKFFNEIYGEISEAIKGHKKDLGGKILELSEYYKKQEEKYRDELIRLECGEKPSLYELGMWSIGIFYFGIFGGSIYLLINDVF